MSRGRRKRAFWALGSLAVGSLCVLLMDGQLGPCGPASVRGAIGYFGFLAALPTFIVNSFLALFRRTRTES